MEESEQRPRKVARRDAITWEEMEAGSSVFVGQPVADNTGTGSSQHSIFLSHNGAQKAFVRRLQAALKRNAYFPFFDEHPDCLPKGEPFAQRIRDASRVADVAVVVLSDEFLNSKWPMIELAVFVREQNNRRGLSNCKEMKILPLFMGLSVEEFRNTERQICWRKKWQEMRAMDDRIDVSEWEEALKVLGRTNGLEYRHCRTEEEYIESIMSAIFKLVSPDVRWDDTHMQGKSKFHQDVAEMFALSPSRTRFHNVRAIGVFGTGGIGKTTICKSLCNEYHAGFNGKVWHAELGKKSGEEIQKDVLRHLVGISEALLSQAANGMGQWRSLLRRRMDFLVFLAIDNVWNEDVSLEQAEALLGMGFHPDSLVVVTSRSREILEWLGIHRECCFEMPVLDKGDATAVLLQCAAPGDDILSLKEYQKAAVERVVERCLMRKGPISSAGSEKQYVPLALEVLGRQLRLPLLRDSSMQLIKWVDNLDLKRFEQKEHPIFSVLRLSYGNLPSSKHKSIFIDVALCVPRQHDNTSASVSEVCKWLSMVHCEEFDTILGILKDLERDGLVERWHGMTCPFGMHELYCEFAKTEVAGEDDPDKQRYLYHEDERHMPFLMRAVPLQSYFPLRRIHLYGGGFRELSSEELQYMVNVEVVKLEFCCELESLDVRCLKRLRSLELWGCFSLEMVQGVEHLKHLKYFRWNTCRKSTVVANFPQALEVVEIYGSKESEVVEIGCLGGCVGLVELTLSCQPMVAALSDVCKLQKLEKVDLSGCCKVEEVRGLECLWRLRHLNLESCKRLRHCDGVELLVKIETLNLRGCVNVEVPIVWDLSRLVNLRSIDIGGILVVKKLVLGSPQLEQLEVVECKDLRTVRLPNDSGSWRFLNRLNYQRMVEAAKSRQWTVEVGGHVGRNLFDGFEAVNLSNCGTLESLGDIGLLRSLKCLYLQNCSMLRTLPNLSGSCGLQMVDLSYCCMLEDLGDTGPLRALQYLYLQNCGLLKSVGELDSPCLKVLDLSRCSTLEDLGNFSSLSSLETLNLSECVALRSIPDLRNSCVLKVLNVKGCFKLKSLPQMTTRNVVMNISECWSLESIPFLNDLSKLELDVAVDDVDRKGVEYLRAWSGVVVRLVLTCEKDSLAYERSEELEIQKQSLMDMLRLKDVAAQKQLEGVIGMLESECAGTREEGFKEFWEILWNDYAWDQDMLRYMRFLKEDRSDAHCIEGIIGLLTSEVGVRQACGIYGSAEIFRSGNVKVLATNIFDMFRNRLPFILEIFGYEVREKENDYHMKMCEYHEIERLIIGIMYTLKYYSCERWKNYIMVQLRSTNIRLKRLEAAIMTLSPSEGSRRWEQVIMEFLRPEKFERWMQGIMKLFTREESETWRQAILEMLRFEKVAIWKQLIWMLRSDDIRLWKEAITKLRGSKIFDMLMILEAIVSILDMSPTVIRQTPERENGSVLVWSCGDDVRHFKNLKGVLNLSEWERRRSVFYQQTHVKFSSVCVSSESLTSLPSSSFYSTVSRLEITKCRRLRQISDLSGLPALETLVISHCDELEKLPDLRSSTGLQHLTIRDFRSGLRFEFLSYLCQPLHAYPTTWMSCSGFENLVEVNLDSCVGLGGLEHWGPLPALESLVINDCNTITQLPNLQFSSNLSNVIVMNCGRFREAGNFECGGAPRVVRIEGCGNEKLLNISSRKELCLQLHKVLGGEFPVGDVFALVDWLRRGDSGGGHHLDMFSGFNFRRFKFTGPTLEKFNLLMKQWAVPHSGFSLC